MTIYDCKVGYVVVTGDSYGMSPCLCIDGPKKSENGNFDVMIFLNLTDGTIYESGGLPGYHTDDCHGIEKIPLEQVEKIKKVWGV